MSNIRNKVMGSMNSFIGKYVGGDKRPVFLDLEKTYPKLLLIDQQFETVKKEFDHIDAHYKLEAYHEFDKGQYRISGKVEPDRKWKVFMLNLMGEVPETALELCPETCKVLQQIPHIYQAFFSILEPMKPIPAHRGPYLGYVRYHIGLKVPTKSPPTMRVHDQFHTWRQGESILFDDTWEHEVINECQQERAVLIVDVFRPLPWWPHNVNAFFIKNVIRNVYAKKMIKNVKAEKIKNPS